jgi:hypothetical protein
MWSAGVEPARPAFQAGALPFELRPQRWARLDSNQRPLVCKTSAQPAELLARKAMGGAGIEPASSSVSERRSASERPARTELRDKDSNLDLHVQSVASSRLRRSRIGDLLIPHLRPPPERELDAAAKPPASRVAVFLCHARPITERCFPSHSPTLRPWIVGRLAHVRAGRRPTWRGFGARSSVAGRINRHAKADAALSRSFHCQPKIFLSQAGPRFRSNACSS